jgi:hypothetical protein
MVQECDKGPGQLPDSRHGSKFHPAIGVRFTLMARVTKMRADTRRQVVVNHRRSWPGRDRELPALIRPHVPSLAEIEARARHDGEFAHLLRLRPQFRRMLSLAVHARDDQARRRFSTVEAIDDHLRQLIAS